MTGALVPYDDGSGKERLRLSDACEVLLQHGEPSTAAAVAIFGLNVVAVPLLEQCSEELLPATELEHRLGLEAAAVARELRAEGDAEVERLQRWRDRCREQLAVLERRSALAFLGLQADAEPEEVQRSFRQKALQAHPDKGGSEEDFQELQAMVEKLQMPSQETSKGFFGMNELIKQCREAREASDGLTEPERLEQQRAQLQEQAQDLWRRAREAQEQLEAASRRPCSSKPSVSLLEELLESFGEELRFATTPLSCERLLCRFLRQGLEALSAAALADATEALRLVALHFTGPLLRLAKTRGPCVRLERRCQGLLKGLGEAPARLEAFLSSLEKPKVQAVEPRAAPAPTEVLETTLQKRHEHSELRHLQDGGSYEDWRKLRARCIQQRCCVNFNRDKEDPLRCKMCGFRHHCAVCGATSHGGWNCFQFSAWLTAHRPCT